MNDAIYRIAWEKIDPKLVEGLELGEYRVYNGVLRKSANNKEIVKHLPLEKVAFPQEVQGAEQLLNAAEKIQDAQAALTGVVAVSTVAIMGAIVVATAYLARKIDKLQGEIAKVQKELQDQNIIFYAEKLTSYFGAIESLRCMMMDRNVLAENPDLIIIKLSEASTLRSQLLSFVNIIINISDGFSPEHKSICIDFVNMSLDLFPKGVFVESQAAYKVDRFALGDSIRETSLKRYKQVLENYQQWGNERMGAIIAGRATATERVIQVKVEDIKAIIHSRENRLMLEHSV